MTCTGCLPFTSDGEFNLLNFLVEAWPFTSANSFWTSQIHNLANSGCQDMQRQTARIIQTRVRCASCMQLIAATKTATSRALSLREDALHGTSGRSALIGLERTHSALHHVPSASEKMRFMARAGALHL